jgi:hypothetical protein
MQITLDDKAITRGYSLKDELIIERNQVFQVNQKLNRLLKEGDLINLKPGLTKEDIIDIIREMVQTTRTLYGQEVL